MHILSFLGKTVPLPTSQPISDGSYIYEETNVGYNATNGKSNTAYNISMKKVSRLNGNDIHVGTNIAYNATNEMSTKVKTLHMA